MFNIFKKKSKVDKLNKRYEKLLEEAHRLSTVNRRASEEKMVEANHISVEIESLQNA